VILPSLRTLFKATTAISPLVSEVYVNTAEQSASLSYLLLTQIDNEFNLRLDGTGGLIFTDVDVDCKAATYVKAQTLADAVKAYFQDYTGTAGDDTVKAVLLNGERSDYEPPQDGSAIGKHVISLDFNVQWST
jgi:hypothetical protein